MVREVIWPTRAQKQLEKAYEYILKGSYQNAEKVKEDVLASTRKLAAEPEIHPPDKYRNNNDGTFRAYELHRYRIAYRVTEKKIIIVRVRHTSQEPLFY
jgi:plasmid stabilization system protein ParE